MKKFRIEILKFSPCSEAVTFREQYLTFKDAWQNCHRGDWMLWIAKMLSVDLKILTKAKAKCDGTATIEELNAYASAASAAVSDAAYVSASVYAAAYAAYTAVYAAASAAYTAVYAAASAADASAAYVSASASAAADASAASAYAAADAAYVSASASAAADAARKKNQLQTADICRELLTNDVFEKLGL